MDKQNPFEIDNVVEILLKHMDIKNIKSSRLLSQTFDKNEVTLLSRPTIQSKLKPIQFINDVERFEDILQNSGNLKLFRNLDLSWASEDQNLGKISEIVQILQPHEIKVGFNKCTVGQKAQLYSSFIFKILRDTFSELVQKKLTEEFGQKSTSFVNLRHLEISSYMDLQTSVELLEMGGILKLTSLTINIVAHNEDYFGTVENYTSMIANLGKFLQSQSKNLEKFELALISYNHYLNQTIPKINLPKFEKVKSLEIKCKIFGCKGFSRESMSSPRSDFWPTSRINFAENFPNLTRFDYAHARNLEIKFDTSVPCETLKELEIDGVRYGQFKEIPKLFPKVRRCKIGKYCVWRKSDIQVWSETLKSLKIHLGSSVTFEDFNFDQLVSLKNLSELEIESDIYPTCPDFTPLLNLKLDKLKKVTLAHIEIPEMNVQEEIRTKYPQFKFEFENCMIIIGL